MSTDPDAFDATVDPCSDGLSEAVEDYLKVIFHLAARDERPTVSTVAEQLDVTRASASAMLKRLSTEGLVQRPDARKVALTPHGRWHALHVVRRHRLLETFLTRVVGLSWDEVHEEADALEHVLSDRLEDRIDEILGRPSHDPHGDPIPPKDGRHSEDWFEPLHATPVGATFHVERISDRDPEALRHLAELRIRPGMTLTVERRDPFDGPLWVRADGVTHPLGPGLTRLLRGHTVNAPPEVPDGTGRDRA